METIIHEYFKSLVDKEIYPGASYAIINKSKIEMGSVGYKSLVPIKDINRMDTLYDMDSLTNIVVTLTLLMKYLESGRIYLDDLVTKYFPIFPHKNITIYDLMTHQSGMAADLNCYNLDNKEELIEAVFTEPIQYEKGKDTLYSNLGYLILGLILEKVGHKSLDILAKEEIFLPLGMYETTFNPEDISRCAPTEVTVDRGIICGTVHDEKGVLMEGICGTAGLFSTIKDMIKFVKMILNDGKVNGYQFLKKETLALWRENLVTGKDGIKRSFSFLIDCEKQVGKLCGDNTISFVSFTGPTLVIDHEFNVAFILLTNCIHPTCKNYLLVEEQNLIMDEVNKSLQIKKTFK